MVRVVVFDWLFQILTFYVKRVITLLSSALCLSVALGSSIVTGDIPGPAEEFHVSEEVVNLTVTLFVVGFGVGKYISSHNLLSCQQHYIF